MIEQRRWGWVVTAFGAGLLLGSFLTLQFLLILVAAAIMAIGLLMVRCC